MRTKAIELVESMNVPEGARQGIPAFRAGDTLRVHTKVVEGEKERVQVFEGICIRRKNGGATSTFTVRKVSYGVGVERIFPLFSPRIDKIEVVRHGVARRAQLYFLRKRVGKAATLRERRQS